MERPQCFERREIEIPDCKESNPDDCHRAFQVYLPGVICGVANGGEDGRGLEAPGGGGGGGDGEDADLSPRSDEWVGTLPLVFAVHCFGCTAGSISNFAAHADSRNAVLIVPEGLHNSFNARHCCGYALEKEVDDVGFFKHIQSMMSDEFPFVNSDVSYAVGWSNGGFMVTHSASLFRSISPISGHVYDIDSALTKGGTFCVDGICVDAPGAGKGIFFHHGKDDIMVRPSGCCKDSEMPQCCCQIAAETCVSVMEVARSWAAEVNACESVQRQLAGESDVSKVDDEAGDGEGGGEDVGEGADDKNEGVDGEDEPASEPGVKFSVSYTDPDRKIECLTATGSECKANTTICLHEEAGHFNQPSFAEKFPLAKEVIDFFARDACQINDGRWNQTSGTCECPESRGGLFCLDEPAVIEDSMGESGEEVDDFIYDSTDHKSAKPPKVAFGYVLFAMAVFVFVRHRYKRGKQKDDRYTNDVIDEDMEEAAELVPSRGRHTK